MSSAHILKSNDEVNICKICHEVLAKYCCPRCNIAYCSLNCYKTINHLQCSENFYRDNVLQEINLHVKKDIKEKMLDILKESADHDEGFLNHSCNIEDDSDTNLEEIDSDDDDYVDLASRLSGVNLDDPDQVWDKLVDDEKQEFIAFIKTEDVTKLIPIWQPWWLFYNENVIEEPTTTYNFEENCPQVCKIKNFVQIQAKSPSECVTYNLINIIYSYIFTARYFNGEHFHFVGEAVNYIISLSLTLKGAKNFIDFATAVSSVEQQCINSDGMIMNKDNFKAMKDDLHQILRGPTKFEKKFYIICALSDIRNLLTESLKPTQKIKGHKFLSENVSVADITSVELKKCRKKIDYYLSFTKDCYLC